MVQFYKANDGIHKYIAEFDNPYQLVKFGAFGYEDYTQHGDPYRKKLYLNRHRKRENWNDPRTAGALSRWILWNKPNLQDSIADYIRRFNMHY
jgi:hypothetical protein